MTVKLVKLLAHFHSEQDGDEIFLKMGKKKIWPEDKRYSFIKDKQIEINTLIPATKNSIEIIELWEYDNIISSQCLGIFRLQVDTKGGPYSTMLGDRSETYANYELIWKVE
jgi:hypothetical protein